MFMLTQIHKYKIQKQTSADWNQKPPLFFPKFKVFHNESTAFTIKEGASIALNN